MCHAARAGYATARARRNGRFLDMKRLKAGVIGAGGLAMGIHLPVLAGLPGVELRAVCDCLPERLDAAAKAFEIPGAYLSYHDMLEKEALDAVFVFTQPDMLFRPACDCLLAGRHVFMEKPMGITAFQARTLRDTAARQNRRLQTGFNRRHIPLVVEMVRRLRELTTVTHVEGRFYKYSSPSFYGGCSDAFICDVIHVIDLVRHLAQGTAVKAVTMETADADTGLASAWYSAIQFDNGVSGVVRANYGTGGRVHQFELHGPGASAYIDLGFGGAGCRGTILLSGGSTYSLSAGPDGVPMREEFDGMAIAGSDSYAVYYGYEAEVRHFTDAVLAQPDAGNGAQAGGDCATMELAQMLLDARM